MTKTINMVNREFNLISILLLVCSAPLSFVWCEQQEVDQYEEWLLPPDLIEKPESLYSELKKHLREEHQTHPDSKVDGLESLTLEQVVKACGSIEGDCDMSSLGRLDDELYFNVGDMNGSPWTNYSIYCREQWLSKCNATEVMLDRIATDFTRDEWLNARQLVDSVLREPVVKNDPEALNIRRRYPKGVVKFMLAKDSDLKGILKLAHGKRDLFRKRYAELVRPVCQQVVSSLKYVVMGFKWAQSDQVALIESLSPMIESALKMFRICLKISSHEDELLGLSYEVFRGTKKGLICSLRTTLSG